MPSHLWLIESTDDAVEQIKAIKPAERKSLFAKIAELAQQENPYSLPMVEKLEEPRFRHRRKIRQGDFRMVFETVEGRVVKDKFVYRGTLQIISVTNRRDTYRRK